MKKIKKIIVPLLLVGLLAACTGEDTPKGEELVSKAKEEQKTNVSKKPSSEEKLEKEGVMKETKEEKSKEEKSKQSVEEESFEEVTIGLTNDPREAVEKKKDKKVNQKDEVKKTTMTKEAQAKEYQKLINTYKQGKEKLIPSLVELNNLTLESRANNGVFTNGQKKRLDSSAAELLIILNEEVSKLRSHKIDENLPENMKKAMRSVQLDLIKDYEYSITTVKTLQKVSKNPYYDAESDMQRIANDVLKLQTSLEAKNEKMEEHFGIDTGL